MKILVQNGEQSLRLVVRKGKGMNIGVVILSLAVLYFKSHCIFRNTSREIAIEGHVIHSSVLQSYLPGSI